MKENLGLGLGIEHVISTETGENPSEALQTSVHCGGVVNNTIISEYPKAYVTTNAVREYDGVPNNSESDNESAMSTDDNQVSTSIKSSENQPALAADL